MLQRLVLVGLIAAMVFGWAAPTLAQGPAVEFMLEQLRRRDDDRRRALQQQQLELQQRELRRQQQLRRARDAAAAQQRAANEVSEQSPRVEELPKDPNARTILVIGDEMAEGLAQGLREAFASDPSVLVVPIIRAQSGLAARAPADWPELVREAIRTDAPLAAVVLLGLEDRRAMTDGNATAEFNGERWRQLYTARIDALYAAFAARRIPVYWTGLPAMRDQALASDASVLNDLFKGRAFASSNTFVDVWEGFVDEEGRYVPIGPDQNGNTRRLRRPDGIGLTSAGNRKLAFYVETALRRDLPLAAPAAPLSSLTPAPDGLTPLRPMDPRPEAPAAAGAPTVPAPPRSFVGPVIQIAPAAARSGGELGAPVNRRDASDIASRVLQRGDAVPAVPGRADDFRWPPEEGTDGRRL